MPIHDWTRVTAGIFHDFHHEWLSEIKHALNRSLKGTEYYALAEQVAGGLGPDVITLQLPEFKNPPGMKTTKRAKKNRNGAVALAKSPPKMRFRITTPPPWFATKKQKAVTIRHVSDHRVIAVLEIVSPGASYISGPTQAFVEPVAVGGNFRRFPCSSTITNTRMCPSRWNQRTSRRSTPYQNSGRGR